MNPYMHFVDEDQAAIVRKLMVGQLDVDLIEVAGYLKGEQAIKVVAILLNLYPQSHEWMKRAIIASLRQLSKTQSQDLQKIITQFFEFSYRSEYNHSVKHYLSLALGI